MIAALLLSLLTPIPLEGKLKVQAGQMVAEPSGFEESPLSTEQTAG